MSDELDLGRMADLPSDDLIEIHDPEIDPAVVMAEIRERIQKRRKELGYVPPNFISFDGARYPGQPEDVPYDADFYYHLEQANELYIEAETETAILPSPATSIPVLGRLWSFVRTQAHGLVLFYVNRAVLRQVNVDRELVSTLNRLAEMHVEQQRTIMKMQAELDALRRQVEA